MQARGGRVRLDVKDEGEEGVADEEREHGGDGEPGAIGEDVGYFEKDQDQSPEDGDERGGEERHDDQGRPDDGADAGHEVGVAHAHGFLVEGEGSADADDPGDASAQEDAEEGAQ